MALSVDAVDIKKRIESCKNLQEVEGIRLEYLGKKGLIPSEMKLLGKLPIDQKKIKRFVAKDNLILVCGKYEGIDQRVIDTWKMEEISLGDYILSGGEIAAMSLIDSCVRLLPNVLGSSKSLESETFENNLLEYPQYTKPQKWEEKEVPEVLLTGDHKKIKDWRLAQSEDITRRRRPDLWEKYKKNK